MGGYGSDDTARTRLGQEQTGCVDRGHQDTASGARAAWSIQIHIIAPLWQAHCCGEGTCTFRTHLRIVHRNREMRLHTWLRYLSAACRASIAVQLSQSSTHLQGSYGRKRSADACSVQYFVSASNGVDPLRRGCVLNPFRTFHESPADSTPRFQRIRTKI